MAALPLEFEMAIGSNALDLGPQLSGWNDPPQLYFYLALIRALYRTLPGLRQNVANAGGSNTYYEQAADDPQMPRWLIASYPGWTVVAVAGTATLDQWVGNLTQSEQGPGNGVPGNVHGFFNLIRSGLFAQMNLALGGVWPENVSLCGHSLGGAAAQLLAYSIEALRPGSVKMVATFGSPKVGDLEFAISNRWPVVRIENYGDFITQAPPATASSLGPVTSSLNWGPCDHYVHAGRGFTLHINGRMNEDEQQGAPEALIGLLSNAVRHGFVGGLPHQAVNYASHLRLWMHPRWRQGRRRGINMERVEHWHAFIAGLEGFTWPVAVVISSHALGGGDPDE